MISKGKSLDVETVGLSEEYCLRETPLHDVRPERKCVLIYLKNPQITQVPSART